MGRIAGFGSVAGVCAALTVGPLLAAPPAQADFDDVAEAMSLAPTGDTASVPLDVEGGGLGQPVVHVSIGGGPSIPVAVDTGSQGLVVSIWDLNPQDVWNELEHFSFDDINIGAFPAGITVGLDVPTSVDFGNGVVAEDTVVNGLLFSFPFSAIEMQALSGASVEGILGIGPNAGGSHLVTADLPGDLGKGVLIDEPGGRLVFGAKPDTVDGLSPITTIAGAPFPGGPHSLENIAIQIGDGPKQTVGAVFDSGGKGGWLPSAVAGQFVDGFLGIGNVPAGVPISVYAPDGALLYSYVTVDHLGTGMTVMPVWLMKAMVGVDNLVNTGNAAFLHNPVYISNADGGAMTFYGPTDGTGADIVER